MFTLQRRAIGVLCLAIFWAAFEGASAQAFNIAPLRSGEYIRDLAGLLEPEDAQRVQEICEAVSADVNAPILVVTVASIQSDTELELPFEAYSVLLFDRLHGRSQNWDKAVLLLVSIKDRKVGIELGSGWAHEDYVSTWQIKEEVILPHFKRDQFSKGIVAGVEQLEKLARGEKMPTAKSGNWYSTALQVLKNSAVTVAVCLLLFGLWSGKGTWGRFFGTRALHSAVLNEDEKRVEKCLRGSIDVDAVDERGATGLFYACRQGYTDIVSILLEYDADPNIATNGRDSPLVRAAQAGYDQIVDMLLSHGAHVDQTNRHRVTPLIMAAYKGNADVVETLVEYGASLEARNRHGLTALFVAVEAGHEEIIGFLLDRGADVNRATEEGITPLMRSVVTVKKSGDLALMHQLLTNGADIDARTPPPEQTTALMMAIQLVEIETVKLLLSSGADIDLKYNFKLDSIGLAEEKGDGELISLLKEHKTKGKEKLNILDAVKYGRLDRVTEILERKPRHVHVKTANTEWTLLHMATMDGNREMAELLIDKGADVHAKNVNGQSARDTALLYGHAELAALLGNYENEKKENLSFFDIAAGGDAEKVKEALLRKPGMAAMATSNRAWTPLHMATASHNKEIVELLLDYGADVNAANTGGRTALHQAAGRGDVEMVRLLLARGADSSLKYHGETPLDRALKMRHHGAVAALRGI